MFTKNTLLDFAKTIRENAERVRDNSVTLNRDKKEYEEAKGKIDINVDFYRDSIISLQKAAKELEIAASAVEAICTYYR